MTSTSAIRHRIPAYETGPREGLAHLATLAGNIHARQEEEWDGTQAAILAALWTGMALAAGVEVLGPCSMGIYDVAGPRTPGDPSSRYTRIGETWEDPEGGWCAAVYLPGPGARRRRRYATTLDGPEEAAGVIAGAYYAALAGAAPVCPERWIERWQH